MITTIAIENFKGIGERIELELRPITLLFGPNSAGKSSVIHALQYLREIFTRRNVNADRTESGGEAFDLGGFAAMIHGRDLSRRIRLEVTVEVDEDGLPRYAPDLPAYIHEMYPEEPLAAIRAATVGIEVVWSQLAARPFVETYSVALDGMHFGEVRGMPGRQGQSLSFPLLHPAAVKDVNLETYDGNDGYVGLFEPLLELSDQGVIPSLTWKEGVTTLVLEGHADALPLPKRWLSFESQITGRGEDAGNQEYALHWFRETISRLIVGPHDLICRELSKLRYLGPLRTTPPRTYEPPRFCEASRWAQGLGAWDALTSATDELLRSASSWLGDDDKLDAGYRLERRRFKRLDLADPLVTQLLTGRAFDDADAGARIQLEQLPTETALVLTPTLHGENQSTGEPELRPSDVGVGISQVVPVIVSALDGRESVVAIEQPELHIHPRLQAKLADLFIEAAHNQQHRFLIETHSEHLILRLQRRIRETTSGAAPVSRQLESEEVVVYFVSQEDGQTKIRRIDLDAKGEFIQPWPDDFFEIDFYERFGS